MSSFNLFACRIVLASLLVCLSVGTVALRAMNTSAPEQFMIDPVWKRKVLVGALGVAACYRGDVAYSSYCNLEDQSPNERKDFLTRLVPQSLIALLPHPEVQSTSIGNFAGLGQASFDGVV